MHFSGLAVCLRALALGIPPRQTSVPSTIGTALAFVAAVVMAGGAWAGIDGQSVAPATPPAKSDDQPSMMMMSTGGDSSGVPQTLPDLSGATAWINLPNSTPPTAESLRGKVVLVDFWAYSCINCLRSLPTIEMWYSKYKDSGLVVIGIHTPEFPFEKNEANVRKAVRKFGVAFPVALDNDYRLWRGFHNQFWPAHYFIDATGRVRYHHFGEGDYEQSEPWIRTLLEERNHQKPPELPVTIAATGAEAARRPRTCSRRRPTLATRAPRTLPRPEASTRTRRNSIARPPNSR